MLFKNKEKPTMKHPDPKINENQERFLKNCPANQREYHAQLFRIGNAVYRYHKKALSINNELAEQYYNEWLLGLPDNIKNHMQKKGFKACKTMLPFTRYVNERNDLGLDVWLKDHLSDNDYREWQKQGK
jgi:hypothetical protein